MKTILYTLAFLMSFSATSQYEAKEDITIKKQRFDDTYLAGESITTDAQIDGDLVAAGNTIVVNDSILQDFLAAGSTITAKGYVKDDIRAAGSKIIIDNVVGDDVIVFGGKVIVTKDAVINGNLIAFSGDVTIDGKVMGDVKVHCGELIINGEITGTSRLVAEAIEIGDNAKFHNDIEYWGESGEVDFENSLVGSKANFNESLSNTQEGFPWSFLGVAAVGAWIINILSALLAILILNGLFQKFFSKTATNLDSNFLKNFIYGLMYVFGLPLLIILTFIIVIGIPIGLFLIVLYIFSLIAGIVVASLVLAHYINLKKGNSWNFWTISFAALGIAAVVRLLTLIPILGFIISALLILLAYGVIAITLFKQYKTSKVLVQ